MGDMHKTLRSAAILALMVAVRDENAHVQRVIWSNGGQPVSALRLLRGPAGRFNSYRLVPSVGTSP
jgi:hypothetical protein